MMISVIQFVMAMWMAGHDLVVAHQLHLHVLRCVVTILLRQVRHEMMGIRMLMMDVLIYE